MNLFARTYLPFMLLALAAGCSAVQPLNPNAPRPSEPPYPVLLAADAQRIEAVSAAWAQLANQHGLQKVPGPAWQPATLTIRSLPENLTPPLYLPRVSTNSVMSDEETRESLRRFLKEWQSVIGANPAQLSLAQQATGSNGVNAAIYEQRLFSYPLRAGYGRVEIRFANDRRVLSLTSTTVPDAEKIQSGLIAAASRLKAEDPVPHLVGRAFNYSDSTGDHSYTIAQLNQPNAQQIVIYPTLTAGRSNLLEFHLAWEVTLSGSPVTIIYYDPLKDEIISASA